jgi:hypothetical protein
LTVSLTALLGVIGLVVDFGWAYWRKEAATSAASAAITAVTTGLIVRNWCKPLELHQFVLLRRAPKHPSESVAEIEFFSILLV